jgi:hypothetical protein
LYRDIKEFKKFTKPELNLLRMRTVMCFADPHSILNRRKNFFNQLLNVHRIHDVRQMDMHMAEPLMLEPNIVKVEISIEKLKRYKSLGTDHIPAELIKTEGETCSWIRIRIHSIWNKEELPQHWKESTIIPIYKKGDKTDCSNNQVLSLLSTAYKILSNILLARLTSHVNEIIGDHQCGFCHNRSTTNQILYIHQTLEKKW